MNDFDKTKWQVEELKEKVQQNTKEIDKLKSFKDTTVEQLKTVFNRLKDIEKTKQWFSQSFFYLILSGAIGAVFFFIQWLVTTR